MRAGAESSAFERSSQAGSGLVVGEAALPDLSLAEFAAAKGVCVRTVRNWIADGYIRARRIGPRLIRIPAAELDVGTDVGGAA